MSRELAREIRSALTDARAVCGKLGLLGSKGTFARQAGGLLVRCPWHADGTPSCSVRRAADGTLAVRCHGCGVTGDVLTLVAQVHGLSLRSDFRRVLVTAAELAGLWQVVEELERGTSRPLAVARPLPPPPAPEPVREYPADLEVSALWNAAAPVYEDAEAVAWFSSRALDAERIGDDVARVIAPDASLPRWASYRGSSWVETGHRVLVPMRGSDGAIRSVRGVRIVEGDSPKRLPPAGHKAAGLVMACAFAAAMLAGELEPRQVLFVEGEPDFFVATTWRLDAPTARIGLVSGGWTPAFAMRVPIGATVYIWTDLDEAGDRYAAEVTRTVQRARGCRVLRWNPTVAA